MSEVRGLDHETLQLTLDTLRSWSKDKLKDEVLLDLDEKDVFPEELVRAIGSEELGIQLIFIPERFGGMEGGAFDVYRVCEEMGRIDLGIATGVLATFLGSDPIVYGGTEEQKARWLSAIAEEGLLMAYGATEPQAGSDLGALRTTATPVEEDGVVVGYTINGNKQWISNGGYADLYTVLAKTPAGPTWFVVDRDTEGLSWGNPEDKHGIRASNTSALSFDEMFVGVDRLVGGVEGQGLVQAQLVFGFTRLMVAAFGLGAGWAALDRAIPYSVDRKQGGSPLSEKQGFTHKLIVPHVVRLEASRAYLEATAERLDSEDGNLNTEGAIAKYLATEAGDAAADAAIQALGGYGYTKEYMVEKYKRDVRITRIYEGTSEIMEMTIARDRWQIHLKSRGEHYHQRARELEALHAAAPESGAKTAALAHHALAEVMERSRTQRLTRNQHVLFRLGELIAYTEGAGALVERAIRHAKGDLNAKGDKRFTAP
ncbi:MAG: acyl-CoA dehydrogenase family protein, partial [Deltaproteobacteria bacterium]|nr:acyl-CoA dehydrogenase family protein [Deltaproteobacteria bacterium]